MNITIKSTNIELTDALRSYTEKRIGNIEKFVGEDALVAIELEKTTNHHKQGEIFRSEVNVNTTTGAQYRAVAEKTDLYAAIDEMKSDITRELSAGKGKERALWRRGASAVKEMMKGGYDVVVGGSYRAMKGGYEKIRNFRKKK